jgi:hypothetical protein
LFARLQALGGKMFCAVYQVAAPKTRDTYSAEWKFNHGDTNSPPTLGVAMSGGGIRSAAFNLGVLQALHDNGIVREVDVMSAVSGGSYTMSWFLLQPFYAAKVAEREQRDFKLDDLIDEMFRPDGRFQRNLSRDPRVRVEELVGAGIRDATIFQPFRAFWAAMGFVEGYNAMGFVRRTYREHLQRLFQSIPSPDSGNLLQGSSTFSCVLPVGYRELAEFLRQNRLPYFIFNATVLVQRACRHKLWPTAFEFTANDLGSDVCGYRTWDDLRQWEVEKEFRSLSSLPPEASTWQMFEATRMDFAEHREWVHEVNIAPAISGAAIGLCYFNPKKLSAEMKLTTWSPFFGNIDLGYMLYREIWNQKGALYVSDGGHCENLGAYALIKRQCRNVIVVDAEHEPAVPYVFAAYTKLKQQLEKEMHLVFAVSDIDSYLKDANGANKPTGPSPAVMTGEVRAITSKGKLISVIYVKLGLDRDLLDSYPSSISDYARKNDLFPQDPTSNQSFTSEQFIAYRDLGCHIASN